MSLFFDQVFVLSGDRSPPDTSRMSSPRQLLQDLEDSSSTNHKAKCKLTSTITRLVLT